MRFLRNGSSRGIRPSNLLRRRTLTGTSGCARFCCGIALAWGYQIVTTTSTWIIRNSKKQTKKKSGILRFAVFVHLSISHPDLLSPSDLQICERIYRKTASVICSLGPVLPRPRCDTLFRKVQPGRLHCQRKPVHSRFRSSMDPKFCKRHEQLDGRFGPQPRARAFFSCNNRHTTRQYAPL